MAYIKVDPSRLQSISSSMRQISWQMGSISSTVSGVRRNLDWDVACENDIDRKLKDIVGRLDDFKARMAAYSDFLGDATQKYSKSEIGKTTSSTKSANASFAFLNSVSNETAEDSRKLLSEFGPVGKAISLLCKSATARNKQGNSTSSIDDLLSKLSKLKDIVKCGGIVEASQKIINNTTLISRFHNTGPQYLFGRFEIDYAVRNFLGLNAYDFRKALGDNAFLGKSGVGLSTLPNNFASGFITGIKNTFVKADGTANKLGIAGTVLNFGIKGIENWKDYKSGQISSVDRVVVETIAETGFDIALTAGVTSAISAGLVAAGATVAGAAVIPAVAVGAASTALVIGVNYLSKKFSGKTLTEHAGAFVGDVWDNAKKVVNAVETHKKKVRKSIYDGFSAIADLVTGNTKAKRVNGKVQATW